MTFKTGLRLSLVAHFLAYWLAIGAPMGCASGGHKDGTEKQEQSQHHSKPDEQILEKEAPLSKDTEVQLMKESKEDIEKRIEKAARKTIAECEPHFGGIGIAYTSNGLITDVYKYYPAYDAGLVPGDVIVSPNIIGLRGPVGTHVNVVYKRDNILYEISITRGRICLETVE